MNLVGLKQGDERPTIAITAVDANSKPLHVAQVDEKGNFNLPDDILKRAHRILIGPSTDNQESVDPDSILRYRTKQFLDLLERGAFNIPLPVWEKWRFYFRCVTGTVKLCRRHPWWYYDLVSLAGKPRFDIKQAALAPKISLRAADASFNQVVKSLPELLYFPYRCQTICNGTVEVYRRTCCCRPWIFDDVRLPELIRELEEVIHVIPKLPPVPDPNPPDPSPLIEGTFIKEGALDEMTLNAQHDLSALRTLPKTEIAGYINARSYLLCRRSCSRPRKIGEGTINPNGRFNICWLDSWRPQIGICHDEYAYVVKQTIFGTTRTIYNGVAANIWFGQNEDAKLVSYSWLAFACRDNGEPGSGAYVFLDIIGDTESWNLKTPDASGWDSVAAPAYNDGLVFPAATPAAAVGANLNRNWGGTLKLNYKFSEDMRTAPVGAKYYRISISEADSSGNPTGTRFYLSSLPSWEKSVPDGMGGADIVPVSLGPNTVGTENNLFLIPYDAEADWNAGQYHGYLNTNDSRWSDPTKRHLVTLEVFDSTGRRLRPTGTPPTGLPGSEGTAPFTFRRRYQDIGPTAEVPFAALTHMFWWDNRAVEAGIVHLNQSGAVFNGECLFLAGAPRSTFGIGYYAFHPNEMFQLKHSISWQRGLGNAAGATGYLLPSSSVNVGGPPTPPPPPAPPPVAPGDSPTNWFSEMLRTDLEPTRKKCAFTVFLSISSKTTDGDYLGNSGVTRTGAFAIEIV